MTADPTEAPALCTVERPDGSTYRAKKPPTAHAWENDDPPYRSGVIVMRTHDVDLARDLAMDEWNRQGWDWPLPSPSVGWARFVPWPESGTYLRAEPNERGAVPCVSFEVDEDA